MKDKILPILLASSILASCSSVYRSGQTPDDVYYSPAREVVKTEKEEEKDKVEETTAKADDQYLKIKVRNRYRWEGIDDYSYWNDIRYNHCNCQCNPGSYGYGYNTNYYYNPIRYYSWNSPYYPIVRYTNPKLIKASTTATNVKAYGNNSYNNNNSASNPKTGSSSNGSLIKRVLTSSGSTVDRTERTFGNNGSSGTSSSSTGTSSSAGGKSGGYGSSGSSSSGGRGGRGN